MFRYILNRCKDWFCMRCFGKTIWLSGDMKALNNVTRISLERFSYFQIVFFKFLHAQYLFCWLNVVRFFSRIFSYLYWSVFTLVLILLTAFKLFKICFFFSRLTYSNLLLPFKGYFWCTRGFLTDVFKPFPFFNSFS